MINYRYEDILTAFHEVGLVGGDTVFLHCNLGYFGNLLGANSAKELCDRFLSAFLEVIGDKGTLIVPTFTYSFCKGEIFDVINTQSVCGIFTEYIRTMKGASRSLDANFSVSGYGKRIEELTKNMPNESFGKGSFWERFYMSNGKIMCMNFDCGSTFVHFVEQHNQVEYRYKKAFNGIVKDGEKRYHDYFVHFVYDKEKAEDGPNFQTLDYLCKQNHICRTAILGKGSIHLMNVEEYYNCITSNLEKQPRFLTEGFLN